MRIKWSKILLIVGLSVLLVGAILSVMQLQPYSDYVLIVGALLVIVRGALRNREPIDSDNKTHSN